MNVPSLEPFGMQQREDQIGQQADGDERSE
jgi:hypothetical protein